MASSSTEFNFLTDVSTERHNLSVALQAKQPDTRVIANYMDTVLCFDPHGAEAAKLLELTLNVLVKSPHQGTPKIIQGFCQYLNERPDLTGKCAEALTRIPTISSLPAAPVREVIPL